jgi:ribosomal-protein-serine acetyltransferase
MFGFQINSNVHLKLLEIRYAQVVFDEIEINRNYLSEFLSWVEKTNNKDDVKSFIEFELRRLSENNGFSCGIFYQNKYIGNISIHDIDWKSRRTSIGYWLSEAFQGKGIITDACRAIIDYSFNELELNKIEIKVRTDNTKSQAIPRRLGFIEEGILRSIEFNNGQYHDCFVFGLLKSEWKRN